MWAAFAAILVLYVFSALRLRPAATFGFVRDDAVYFSLGKALAEGQGYVLPSFPGHLASINYPPLYPMLLAVVWKIDPRFPGNVPIAVGITLAFGCLALLVTFLMLRRWPELGDWAALVTVLLIAFCSEFVYLSPMVLSDLPFMALMLGAAWLAELALDGAGGSLTRPYKDAWLVAGAGLLSGMSVGLRALGIPVAAGIGLLLLWRRQFKKLFWFCLTGLPLTLYWSWPAVSGILGLTPRAVGGDPTHSGWTQTVCFYTSYACQWRMWTPNLEALKSTVLLNLKYLAQEPGMLLLNPLVAGGGIGSLVLVMLASAGAYVGIARSWRRGGCRPLHAIAPLYAPVLLVFPFAPYRYLVPFAPLFLAGLWLEVEHVGRIVEGCLRPGAAGCGKDERIAAWILGLVALALTATVAANYGYTLPRQIGEQGAQNELILKDEKPAYAWIREHAAPDARVISNEDGLTYLLTGRQSAVPIRNLAGGYFLHEFGYVQHDAAHLADVARHIRASYWLTSPYDYTPQTGKGQALLVATQGDLLAKAPVVYRSADGLVTLYDTRCLFGALPPSECVAGAPASARGRTADPSRRSRSPQRAGTGSADSAGIQTAEFGRTARGVRARARPKQNGNWPPPLRIAIRRRARRRARGPRPRHDTRTG